ncbi:MAG: thiamine pyrophosphate-dependent enzyme [Solirubrobacteraceae bacterium]
MPTVAELIVKGVADLGVKNAWGVVGDALNPVTDAIRREHRLEWIGVRHEEAGAFAAGAQAHLSGTLGVCMGTVGPGSIHLLNGLYDAKKSRVPLLALCGQVPLAEIGSDFFQEVDNDQLFADVAAFSRTIMSPEQMPLLFEQAVQTALARKTVAVLTLPGDVGAMDVPDGTREPSFTQSDPPTIPDPAALGSAADRIESAASVAILAGQGARHARHELLALADRLAAPMVLTLKAKDGLERDNPYELGQTGMIGNPPARKALEAAELLLMVGTDFPYVDWYPEGKVVVQIDVRGEHIGRRTNVDAGVIGDAQLALAGLLERVSEKTDRSLLDVHRAEYERWREDQLKLADPHYDERVAGRARAILDNPEHRIRPEALAAAIDTHAADDAIFTSDTGMSTVWLSRFVTMRGTRRLMGSYNLGSMANAMPHALGAQALDRNRQVIAFCGDGGLTMLLGDLLTAAAYDLPATFVVFDNGRLGMVKLEQEQGGLPEFGTKLHNPDLAEVARAMGLTGIRVDDPGEIDGAVRDALATAGPVLLDVLTNPEEVSLPPKVTPGDAWGFAVAKLKETVASREG